mmetsp:Transcript_74701/g.216808  ORF Transcript_74701/g.216808 Transcript_74701/m.216808 type:complete len:283 (-) Transcript_74701:9-857(-)
MVQEGAVVVVDLEAEGMVEADRVGAERAHHSEVVAAIGAPLRRIARLRHVLRREAHAATDMLRARKRAVGDAFHGAQRRQVAMWQALRRARARRQHLRRGRRLLRRLCLGALEQSRGAHAPPLRHGATPCIRDRTRTQRQVPRQVLQPRIQAVNRPLEGDGACRVQARLAKTKQAEVHLGSALPVGRLKLEHRAAHEEAAVLLSRLPHALQVRLNGGLRHAVATVLADKPRDRRKAIIVFCDHLLHEAPRRLSVQPVHPPRPKGLGELPQGGAGLVPSDRGI